ncbi:DUF624 domain-containing protein [Propionibacteriaceae bacterium Y2011]
MSTTAGTRSGERLHRLYDLAVWPPRVAALSGMWLLGVLAGGILLGLAPATVAAHATALRWHDPEGTGAGSAAAVWRTFWVAWRSWLWRSQLPMGFAYLTLVPFAFWLDAVGIQTALGMPLACLAGWWLITIQWLPSALVGATGPRRDLPRITVHLAWRRWPASLGAIILLAVLAVAGWWWVPFALPFVFPGLPAILITRLARRTVELEQQATTAGGATAAG